MKVNFERIYWVNAALVLTMPALLPADLGVYIFKPLIGIILFYAVYRGIEKAGLRNLLLAGILFSLLGDLALMFTGELVFLLGLGSFLLCQILYSVVFIRLKSRPFGGILSSVASIASLSYATALLIFLEAYVGKLLLPVGVYALAISVMLILAIGLFKSLPGSVSWMLLIGALAFVLSDSLLAFEKFVGPYPYSRVLVMGTYLLAQYGIVFGLIRLRKVEA